MLSVLALLLSLSPINTFALTSQFSHSTAYKSSVYYSKLKAVTLGNNGAENMVKIAESQLGYHEGNSTADLGGGNTSGNKNYCEFNTNLGFSQAAWCATFVSWCAVQAGETAAIPKTADPNTIHSGALKAGGASISASQVKAGDLVFYLDSTNGKYCHVGIMTGPSATIEGNYSNKVRTSSPASYVGTNGSVKNGVITVKYVRPNYSGTTPPQEEHTTHSYDEYVFFEAVHPHRNCYKCSCGDIQRDYSSSNYLDTCVVCNTPSKPSFVGMQSTYASSEEIKFTWTETTHTTNYYVWVFKKTDNGDWGLKKGRRFNYGENNWSVDLEAGEYRCVVASYNYDLEDSNGSELNTSGEYHYFTVTDLPYNVTVKTSKEVYEVGETVWIIPRATNQDGFTIRIDKDTYANIVYSNYEGIHGITAWIPKEPGEYTVHISAVNNVGYTNASCVFVVNDDKKTPGKPALKGMSSQYKATDQIEFKWDATVNTTHYNMYLDQKDSDGEFVRYKNMHYVENGMTMNLPAGEYRVVLQSTNSEEWTDDGSTWLYTDGDFVYFTVESKFVDVKSNDWFYSSVEFAVDNGLFNGVAADKFAPNMAMNRAMLVTVLYRMEGEPAISGAMSFTDVKSGQYYYKAVLWASQRGIVNGVSANRFAPEDNITREQMAAILYRYSTTKGYDVSAIANIAKYPDAGKISSYAMDAFSWANAEGLIGGTDIGGVAHLDPKGKATRAQVATILMRFKQNVA